MNLKVHGGVRSGWIFAFLVFFVGGCAGYVPGRQAYWDAQVREMCAKDGGVRIFEKISITRKEAQLLGRSNDRISVPMRQLAHPSSIAYTEATTTYLRDANPRVSRTEYTIVRRSDHVPIAKWVIYSRFGGDIPSPAHESALTCPTLQQIDDDLQALFIIDGE